MRIKVKKFSPTAILPTFGSEGAAGADLYIDEFSRACPKYIEVNTNLGVEIPKGFGGFLLSRSSISNYEVVLANGVGLIDSDYRGPIKLRLYQLGDSADKLKVGMRVAQLVILPIPPTTYYEAELSESNRGMGSFGSSGV